MAARKGAAGDDGVDAWFSEHSRWGAGVAPGTGVARIQLSLDPPRERGPHRAVSTVGGAVGGTGGGAGGDAPGCSRCWPGVP